LGIQKPLLSVALLVGFVTSIKKTLLKLVFVVVTLYQKYLCLHEDVAFFLEILCFLFSFGWKNMDHCCESEILRPKSCMSRLGVKDLNEPNWKHVTSLMQHHQKRK